MQVMEDDAQVDAVFGRMRIRLDPGATPWQWVLDLDGRHVLGPNLGTALFRSRFLRRIGGFDESLRFGEDVDYFLRLQEAGMHISLCDTDGLIYRRHASNCTDDQLAVNNSIFDVIKRRGEPGHGPQTRMTLRTSVIMPVRDGQLTLKRQLIRCCGSLHVMTRFLSSTMHLPTTLGLILARIQDPRVRIFDGFGRGASAARNIGLSGSGGRLRCISRP